jgi:peptidyl-prolyl cis-trans isomerase A (cyclophilin A)
MRLLSLATIVGLVLFAAAPRNSTAQAPEQQIVVQVSLSQDFYYEGDPLDIHFSVQNLTEEKRPNPIRTPLLGGFTVRPAGGEVLKPRGKSSAQEPVRPDELTPGAFYGMLLDITELYPELKTEGTYQIHWSGGALVSRMLVVTILPRYDPTATYTATVETGLGAFQIRFFGDKSPIAVKSVIDMARVGVYDGLQIHELHADSYIVGGDPLFAERPRRGITFPAEFSTVPLVAGTVVMKPVSAAPPANGSTFMITLKPQPAWTGQVTVVGQIVKGLDVVRAISRRPSSMQDARPFFKPLDPIVIDRVTVAEEIPRTTP